MAHILTTLFPVFAVIALGYGLAKREFLSRGFLNELNKLVYWIALPALMIHSMAGTEQLPGGTATTLLIYLGASLLVLGAALLNAKLLGLARWQFGTFTQAAFRGNLAFIGIPILIYALRNEDKAVVSTVVAQAVLIFAPVMIFYNTLSVILLIGSHETDWARNLGRMFRSIASNPLIVAALIGILIFLLPVGLPVFVANTLEFVGRMAGPAALVCVGGGMAMVSMEGRYRSALFAALLKTGGVPLAAWLLSRPFGLEGYNLLILMIFSATPTAVASYVMAKEMHGDEAMASGGIVLSTILSVISLGIIVGLF